MRALPLLLLLSCAPASPAADRRPNIVVILCDDLGYGDLGAYGHPAIKTPHLDRMAAEGWRFTDGYSAAPVCSPSRVGLMTGRTPSRYGVYDWIAPGSPVHLRGDAATLPKLLKRAGYDTALAGKWHCNGKFNSPEQPQPGDHGFDHWFATQNNAGPSHQNPRNFVRNGKDVGPLEGWSCQLVVDEAVRWIGKRRERPYFLYVAFHEPHEPVASPPDLVAEYAGKARNADEAQYFANVANMDRAVGRLLEAVGDDAFVYFSSDNGPETLNRYARANRSYGTPGGLRGMKLWLYEGGLRVPTIVRWPGRLAPGRVVDTPVASLDVLPTACAIAGVAPPGGLDGTSLLPLFDGRPLERSTPLYWHYYRGFEKPKAAMRDGDWMILGHWDGPMMGPGGSVKPGDSAIIKRHALVGFELYNLREDPRQQRDAAASQPAVLDRLSKALVAKYREVQAEAPLWD